MVNVIVLWQTVYTQAALEHLAASGCPLDPVFAVVARLPRSATPRSTSMAGTGPPADHPPPDSGRYEPIYSGSRTDPRHRPRPAIAAERSTVPRGPSFQRVIRWGMPERHDFV